MRLLLLFAFSAAFLVACTFGEKPKECGTTSVLWYSSRYQTFSTFRDPSRNKCVLPIDTMCNARDDNCPSNSKCAMMGGMLEFGYCRCLSGFVKSDNLQVCGKPGRFNDTCTENIICDKLETGTTCLMGTCLCASGIYDVEREKCKSLAGDHCSLEVKRIECVANAECYGSVCHCSDGHIQTTDNFCHPGPGTSCSSKNPCYDGLTCLDGACACKHPFGQLFNTNTKTCENSVGSKCGSQGQGSCVENADCANGVCACKDGFSTSGDGKCKPRGHHLSKKCGPGECNAKEGLACVNGSCTCADPSLKYISGSGCVTTGAGERCGWILPSGGQPCREGPPNCYFVTCRAEEKCVYNPNGGGKCE